MQIYVFQFLAQGLKSFIKKNKEEEEKKNVPFLYNTDSEKKTKMKNTVSRH